MFLSMVFRLPGDGRCHSLLKHAIKNFNDTFVPAAATGQGWIGFVRKFLQVGNWRSRQSSMTSAATQIDLYQTAAGNSCYGQVMVHVITPLPVFRAEGVTRVYRTGAVEVWALRGVDLSLAEGDMVVLLGASGSGKSTLVNILGGLDLPTDGRVFFRDKELTRASDRELTAFRRDHVGFVFQFYNLVPSLTARENVALVTEIADDPMTPEEALERVGLVHRLDHFPAELSGGEQQRVAIARAIAKRPDVLLCDEPTGALDSKTGIQVLEALDSVNRDLGTATVLITHNASIQRIAHRVIVLADGRVIRDEPNTERVLPSEISW